MLSRLCSAAFLFLGVLAYAALLVARIVMCYFIAALAVSW